MLKFPIRKFEEILRNEKCGRVCPCWEGVIIWKETPQWNRNENAEQGWKLDEEHTGQHSAVVRPCRRVSHRAIHHSQLVMVQELLGTEEQLKDIFTFLLYSKESQKPPYWSPPSVSFVRKTVSYSLCQCGYQQTATGTTTATPCFVSRQTSYHADPAHETFRPVWLGLGKNLQLWPTKERSAS